MFVILHHGLSSPCGLMGPRIGRPLSLGCSQRVCTANFSDPIFCALPAWYVCKCDWAKRVEKGNIRLFVMPCFKRCYRWWLIGTGHGLAYTQCMRRPLPIGKKVSDIRWQVLLYYWTLLLPMVQVVVSSRRCSFECLRILFVSRVQKHRLVLVCGVH